MLKKKIRKKFIQGGFNVQVDTSKNMELKMKML